MKRLIPALGLSLLAGLLVLLSIWVAHSRQASQECTLIVTADPSVQSASQSIQVAVAEAPAHALICLPGGVYQENVRIIRDDITLKGEGPDKTILTGSLLIQGVRRVSVQDLTIRNGAFGIKLEGGELITLRNNRIENSTGRGVELLHVGLASLENNFIQGHAETGLLVSLDSLVRLERNQIFKNGRDGVEVAGSKADLRHNQIKENTGCGIRVDPASTATGRDNEILRNTDKNLCGQFPEGFVIAASMIDIAVLDESSQPSYADGRLRNSVEAVLQMARDRGLSARRITSSDISAGELDAFTVLVLPDNAPPLTIADKIVTWWIRGNHLIALDSAVSFLLYTGLLAPELRGRTARDSKGVFWDYTSSGTIVIQREHPITAGLTFNQEIACESASALLSVNRLPQGFEVLALDKIRKDGAAVVFYRGPGIVTFIGPDENATFLKSMIANAMALGRK
jgi:hypothetical protein